MPKRSRLSGKQRLKYVGLSKSVAIPSESLLGGVQALKVDKMHIYQDIKTGEKFYTSKKMKSNRNLEVVK